MRDRDPSICSESLPAVQRAHAPPQHNFSFPGGGTLKVDYGAFMRCVVVYNFLAFLFFAAPVGRVRGVEVVS